MKIKENDFDFFKKLKIKSAIDLALILPKKIENLSPSPRMKKHKGNVLTPLFTKSQTKELTFF